MNRVGVPRRRLFVWALLIGAVAGVGLTLWQMHQGSLDAALLTAIREDDTHAAIALLDQGANANATFRIGRAESLDLLFRDLQDWLHGQRPPQRSYFAPALYLAFMHEPGVGPSRVSEALSGLRLPHRPFSGTARTFDPAREFGINSAGREDTT